MEKDNNYISPILLFLASSVVLFLEQPNSKEFAAALEGERGILAGLGFLSIPLIFSLAIELFRPKEITRNDVLRDRISRDGILRILYIQCYYLSPVTLSIFAFFIADFLLVDTIPGATRLFMYIMFGLLIWFPIVQVNLIARELKAGILKSIGVLTICTIVILVGVFIFYLFSDENTVAEDANYEGENEEVTDLSMRQSDKYTIVIWGFEESVGNYRLILSEANGSEPTESLVQGDEADCLTVAGPITYGECGLGTVTVGANSIWTFMGMEGDSIDIIVNPDDELDVAFEVLDAAGNLILEYDKTWVVKYGSYLYILMVGLALVIGFWSLIRKPEKQKNGGEGVTE